jgi:hypothetical protein
MDHLVRWGSKPLLRRRISLLALVVIAQATGFGL